MVAENSRLVLWLLHKRSPLIILHVLAYSFFLFKFLESVVVEKRKDSKKATIYGSCALFYILLLVFVASQWSVEGALGMIRPGGTGDYFAFKESIPMISVYLSPLLFVGEVVLTRCAVANLRNGKDVAAFGNCFILGVCTYMLMVAAVDLVFGSNGLLSFFKPGFILEIADGNRSW